MGDFIAKIGRGNENASAHLGMETATTSHNFKIMNTYLKKNATRDGHGEI